MQMSWLPYSDDDQLINWFNAIYKIMILLLMSLLGQSYFSLQFE